MSEKTVFQGAIFSVVSTEITIDGKTFPRDIVRHHGGVGILAVSNDRILLVRQTRAAAGKKMLEIPAGTIEPGEDPLECAIRELNEEGGLQSDSWKLISRFFPTPGYCTEQLWIYQADDCTPVENRRALDEGEDIEIVWMPVKEAWKAVRDLQIEDGKTIIAIQHLLLEREE